MAKSQYSACKLKVSNRELIRKILKCDSADEVEEYLKSVIVPAKEKQATMNSIATKIVKKRFSLEGNRLKNLVDHLMSLSKIDNDALSHVSVERTGKNTRHLAVNPKSLERTMNEIFDEYLSEKIPLSVGNSEFVTLRQHLHDSYPPISRGVSDATANDRISDIIYEICKAGILPKQNKDYLHTRNYFRRDDKKTKKKIDDFMSNNTKEGVLANPNIIIIADLILEKYPNMVEHLNGKPVDSSVNGLVQKLKYEGIIKEQEKPINKYKMYIMKDDFDALKRIDDYMQAMASQFRKEPAASR